MEVNKDGESLTLKELKNILNGQGRFTNMNLKDDTLLEFYFQ